MKPKEKERYNDIKENGAEKRSKALVQKIKESKENGIITPMLKR
jgi:hypothetical protein